MPAISGPAPATIVLTSCRSPLLRPLVADWLGADWERTIGAYASPSPVYLSIIRLLLSGHQAVAIENAALRLQLAAFQRKGKRPVLTTFDRVFWITLRRLWSGWRRPLFYVQADTVVRWQRERFRRFWARLSKRHIRRRGRPATTVEIRRLIERMVVANPLWRAPRIHGELKMLGIAISERTVSPEGFPSLPLRRGRPSFTTT
jgi:hypothetical protein